MSNANETIEKSVKRLLELMDFDTECSIKEQIDPKTDKKTFTCSIKTQHDSRFLIGQHGSNLYALEHLIRSILYKSGYTDRVNIDINGYKEDKNRIIANIAKDSANQAAREKKPVILRPMNAYERRIVHMTIADDTRIITESVGERDDRKVIIKPQSVIDLSTN